MYLLYFIHCLFNVKSSYLAGKLASFDLSKTKHVLNVELEEFRGSNLDVVAFFKHVQDVVY